MSEEQARQSFERARNDVLIAAGIAAVMMIGAALFAPSEHLWGVALGALLALANLAALARLTSQMLSSDSLPGAVALKTVAKVLGLMGVVVAVLVTRPQYALGLCLGLSLPALAGIVLILRGREHRAQLFARLRAGATRE